MGLLYTLLSVMLERPLLSTLGALLVVFLLLCCYRSTVHPLSKIPGPVVAKLSSVWLYYHSYIGDESTVIYELHRRYGPIVQVSPDQVDIADSDAIAPIYVNNSGFPKAPCYANFDFDGHETIFSTRNVEYRNIRAKTVVSLFSTKSIREGMGCINSCADIMVSRLQQESKSGRPVNLLKLSRSFAINVVSTYLFQQKYDPESKEISPLSSSAYVDEAVAVGRFLYLPTWAFHWMEWVFEKCFPDEHVAISLGLVDDYVESVVTGSRGSESFPERLLAQGIEKAEVKVQSKDLIFAGTDSSGMNLATILSQLVRHPDKYDTLRHEVLENESSLDKQDIQSLPYLSAVVKEALRISMANPTRLVRSVPHSGWTHKSSYFPAGTLVGCSTYQLHFDEAVFTNSREFEPERWLDGKTTETMNKHWFAFGAGPRGCLARNLATTELFVATKRIVESDVLRHAQVCQNRVEVFEWFNAKVKGEKIELVW